MMNSVADSNSFNFQHSEDNYMKIPTSVEMKKFNKKSKGLECQICILTPPESRINSYRILL